MKKWIIMIMLLSLLLTMAACGKKEQPIQELKDETAAELPAEEQQETAAEPEAEQTEVEEPTGESSEEVTEESETPAEEAEDPVEAAPGEMARIYGVLTAMDVPAMLPLDAEMQLDYCGIDSATVKESVVAICADSLRADEIWLIEAQDEDAAKAIVGLAEFRLEQKSEESITYSPEQYEVIQKAVLLQKGNYVILLVSPIAETLWETVERELK